MLWTMLITTGNFALTFCRPSSMMRATCTLPPSTLIWPNQTEHRPAEDLRRLCGGETRTIVQRLATECDDVRAADFVDRRRQHARRALCIEGVERRVRDENGFIRAHGERMFERFLGGLRSDAQCGNRSAVGFLELKRAFDGVLIKRIDDQRRFPPRHLPILGFDFRFRVRDLFDAGYDFQCNSPNYC